MVKKLYEFKDKYSSKTIRVIANSKKEAKRNFNKLPNSLKKIHIYTYKKEPKFIRKM